MNMRLLYTQDDIKRAVHGSTSLNIHAGFSASSQTNCEMTNYPTTAPVCLLRCSGSRKPNAFS